MKKIALLFLVLNISVFAQHTTKENTDSPNTIENLFTKIYHKSLNWKEFKMIKRTEFVKFQSVVLDSVSKIKGDVKLEKAKVSEQNTEIKSLQTEIADLNVQLNELKSSQGTENNLKTILLGIIGVLALALGFYIFKHKHSNNITKTAKKNLQEIEEEFDSFRKRSLEREQKLRRQLQDEINKQHGTKN